MTLESALPYVSIACAVGAAAAAAVGPSPGVQRPLKALALLSLAVFAFLRGVAPAGMAMALVLSGLGWAFSPREPGRRTYVSTGLFVLAWLVLAWLSLREGRGIGSIAEPARLVAGLVAVADVAAIFAWSRREPTGVHRAALAEVVALGLLVLATLTLRDVQWPAMAGAFALLLAHGLGLVILARPGLRLARMWEILSWVLSYAGQAAMAYVFLR